MQFTVDYASFLNHVQYCQNAVDRKKLNELLEHIHLRVDDDVLHLSATDNFLYMQAQIGVQDSVPGCVLVPAKKLYDILRELPAGEAVHCTLDGQLFRIRCGRARFRLNTLAAEGFPEPPEERIEQRFKMPSAMLAKIIQMSVFCISTDETRKFLNGASFVYEQAFGQLQIRTSNGFHMGLLAVPMQMDSELNECLIHLRTLQEMRRLCEAIAEPVSVGLGAHQACLEFARVRLYSKTIEEHFPPYGRLLGEDLPSMLEVAKEPLERALRRCLLVSDELNDVEMTLDEAVLELSASNRNQESANEPVDADLALADDLPRPYRIELDGMFLREILQVLPGERVQIHFRDNRSMIMIVDSKDKLARYIMMPLRS